MRKRLIVISAASALFASALVSPFTPSRVFAETASNGALYQGISGDNVKTLQTELKTIGYFTHPTVTGYFGSMTAEAVAEFQRDYRLSPTGTADSITQTAIEHAVVKKRLVEDSYRYIGTPYVWGGSSPEPGFDCSGFISFLFNKFGVPLSRTTADHLYLKGFSVGRTSLQPGDLVFFRMDVSGRVSHAGIYIGGGRFISATSSKGIYIQSLDSSYWGPKYAGARRIY